MSEHQPIPVPASQPASLGKPPNGKKPRRWLVPVVVGVVAASIGYGAAGGAAEAPEPIVKTETIEKEVPVEVEKIVEKEVEVVVEVPTSRPSCLQALDIADEGFNIASGVIGAIQSGDLATARELNAELAELVPSYGTMKTDCRNA